MYFQSMAAESTNGKRMHESADVNTRKTVRYQDIFTHWFNVMKLKKVSKRKEMLS